MKLLLEELAEHKGIWGLEYGPRPVDVRKSMAMKQLVDKNDKLLILS